MDGFKCWKSTKLQKFKRPEYGKSKRMSEECSVISRTWSALTSGLSPCLSGLILEPWSGRQRGHGVWCCCRKSILWQEQKEVPFFFSAGVSSRGSQKEKKPPLSYVTPPWTSLCWSDEPSVSSQMCHPITLPAWKQVRAGFTPKECSRCHWTQPEHLDTFASFCHVSEQRRSSINTNVFHSKSLSL